MVDVSTAIQLLQGAGAAVSAVGAAVTGVQAGGKAFSWLRQTVGVPVAADQGDSAREFAWGTRAEFDELGPGVWVKDASGDMVWEADTDEHYIHATAEEVEAMGEGHWTTDDGGDMIWVSHDTGSGVAGGGEPDPDEEFARRYESAYGGGA